MGVWDGLLGKVVDAGTVTSDNGVQLDLNNTTGAKLLREYKKSVIEPKGIEFNKRQTEHQIFPEEYFTGTDVYVYFNDLWIDELTGLQFSLAESVVPIYGYSSNTWDYVARGKRIVEGTFRLAFKEAGYMFVVLDHIGKNGNHKKTAISWLLNDEQRDLYGDGQYRGIDGVPEGYADVLENVEQALGRIHGDPSAKTEGYSYDEDYVWEFKWKIPMTLGSPNTDMGEKRTSTNQTGQVAQLQQRLIDLGFGWGPWDPKWTKHYGNDTWYVSSTSSQKTSVYVVDKILNEWKSRTGKSLGRNSGDWYCGFRYWPETANGHRLHARVDTSRGNTASQYERDLQKRLDTYPGNLKGLWMGSPDGKIRYDGRYGSGPTEGIRLFEKLAGINSGTKGYFVQHETYEALKLGLAVHGRYDVATRVAVWLFQETQLAGSNPFKIKEANGIVDAETKRALAEKARRTVKVPGENRYNPGEMAEPLFSIYEKEVWGRPFVERAEDVRSNESFFYRSRRTEEHGVHLESLYQNGFDIYINYGPLPQYIQTRLNKIPDGGSFNTTIKAIRNVQLTGVQQVLDAVSGQPIEEIYSFIARDLD